ncbi:hypothetical protein [Cellulophaga baltica]|uniref:Uncharacterized protein n=1 Tax=Cellulophaga baltica 18 TaxID=1348584 RepID=A0AAU8RLH2_9FLAO|nr:hypothetical protein [Cellulophaga baltica]AIZ40352.1 hypothetical protein M666_01405 [Cellulophaga baltica 18]
MKTIKLLFCLLIFTSFTIQRDKKNIDNKDITLEVKVEKTEYNNDNSINLYVVIKNNSDQDITILRPSSKYGYQMDFFKVTYECEVQYPFGSMEARVIKKTDTDLITIKSKSETELILKGNLYNVKCNNPNITEVVVTYDTTEELSERIISRIGVEENKIKEKLTKIKIENTQTTIE